MNIIKSNFNDDIVERLKAAYTYYDTRRNNHFFIDILLYFNIPEDLAGYCSDYCSVCGPEDVDEIIFDYVTEIISGERI